MSLVIEHLPRPASDDDLAGLAELLVEAVNGGASVSFPRPLKHAAATEWWRSLDPRI